MLDKPAMTVRRARKLRRSMTLPEVLLWRELRKRPGGFRYRRQHPAGSFVLDFYCPAARLCIEVDGFVHDTGDRSVRDASRDRHLAKNGVATLRIPARDVMTDVAAAVTHIVESARSRLPLHHPAARGGPPPRDKLGED